MCSLRTLQFSRCRADSARQRRRESLLARRLPRRWRDVDDGVARVPGDGQTEGALGVEQLELGEGAVEQTENVWLPTSFERVPCLLLALEGLSQRLARFIDPLGGWL